MNLHPASIAVLPRRQASRGFTMIELIVTVAIAAVLAGLAVPSFTRMIASNRLTSQTNEFILALSLTRSEAVKRAQPVTLRTADATNPVFQGGWTMFPDLNGNGAAAGASNATDGEVLRQAQAVSGTTTITRVTRGGSAGAWTYATATAAIVPDRMYLTFNAYGAKFSGAAAFFRICDSAMTTTLRGRVIRVSPVGTVGVVDTDASCT